MSGLDPEFTLGIQHQNPSHSSLSMSPGQHSTVEPHVSYSASICAIIGHSRILTEASRCSRCGEGGLPADGHYVMLHRSGFHCYKCEEALPHLTFWDRLMLPETALALFQAMKPNASRPNLTGACL